jgi:pyroglutamyl-peptidase
MPRVLITAFQRYAHWPENSSWLALMELTRDLPQRPVVTTRVYPVELSGMKQRLWADLAAGFDFALHLGQSPGSGHIALEAVSLNVVGPPEESPDRYGPLAPDGPVAYRSDLPLREWAGKLRQAGIPSEVSYHAGTYLCNAVLYLSQYFAERNGLRTRAALLHLPLEACQTAATGQDLASMPRAMAAAALRIILAELAGG